MNQLLLRSGGAGGQERIEDRGERGERRDERRGREGGREWPSADGWRGSCLGIFESADSFRQRGGRVKGGAIGDPTSEGELPGHF